MVKLKYLKAWLVIVHCNSFTINFNALDAKINSEIDAKLFPGAALAIIDGNKVYTKTYGYLDYSKKTAVNRSTLYDLASLTKVIATTPAIMYLVENGQINLNDQMSKFLPNINDLKNITVQDLLTHQSGLKDLPFKKNTTKKLTDIFTKKDDKSFLYTDINMILLGKIVEEVTGEPLDKFVQNKFYKQLKMNNTVYKPQTEGLVLKNIAPTEDLTYGFVHDEKALNLLNQVAGHAGLFSNISDLIKFTQAFLKRKLFTKQTYDTFFNIDVGTNYALGWRKGFHIKELEIFNPLGFSHLGFTGCTFWLDFEKKFALIMLTNRIHPSRDNLNQFRDFRTWLAEFISIPLQTLLKNVELSQC